MSWRFGDIVNHIRHLNPWRDVEWPEKVRRAADVIEAQRQEMERLRQTIDKQAARIIALERAGEEAIQFVQRAQAALNDAKDQLLKQQGRIVQLEERRRMRH
jgi:small-conductance mechanosensitive channel